MLPRFVDVLLKLTRERILRERQPHIEKVIWRHEEYQIIFDLQSLSDLYGCSWLDPRSLKMKLYRVEPF